MKHRSLSRFVAVCAALVVALVSVAVSRVAMGVASTTTAPPGSADAGTSVVWLVLDEAPLWPLLRTDGTINARRFPGFAELASVSTWYRDTLTTAQRTTEAVPAMLTGVTPTIRNYPVHRDHPVNLFTLARGHKTLDVYQSITSLCPVGLCANKIPDEERAAEYQVAEFERLTRRVATSTEPTMHFSHILLPHRPWRLSSDMRIGRELPVDPRPSTLLDRRRDSYQGLLRQYVATDSLLKEFLAALRASRNWERTMLIVTSDHGMTFVPGESFRDKVNPRNAPTLDDIYRVPLFVKYPGQEAARVNDCPASTLDILPTVLEAAEIPGAPRLDGVDLAATCPQRDSRLVQWPYTGTKMTTRFPAVLDRVRYYDTWVAANGTVNDIQRVGLSGELIGTRVPAGAGTMSGISWSSVDPAATDGIGNARMEYAPTRFSLRATLRRALCRRCEGLLVVDGTVVGVFPELASQKPAGKPVYATTSVHTAPLDPSSASPELWIADWSRGTPLLLRVGLPESISASDR